MSQNTSKTQMGFWFRFLMALVLTVPFIVTTTDTAQAETEVGGPIISDTTWTLAKSPYIVIANIEVWEGVTLTIQPGVVVKFDDHKLLKVDGTLIAKGYESNRISFTSNKANPLEGDWGQILFTDNSVDAEFDSGVNYIKGSILQYCIVEYAGNGKDVNGAIEADYASPLIDNCIVRNNRNLDIGGQFPFAGISGEGTSDTPIVITNNTVSHNFSGYKGGGIYARNGMVIGNTVSDNTVDLFSIGGGGIYARDSLVKDNIVFNNWSGDNGGGIFVKDSTVVGNTVTNNKAIEPYTGGAGGGIYADAFYAPVIVSNNYVSGNSAISGGGIVAHASTGRTITVTNNIVSNNFAKSCGGISSNGTTMNNIIFNNYADSGGGMCGGGGVIRENTIVGNKATGQGSGLSVSGSEVIYNTIISNTTTLPSQDAMGGVAISWGQLHNNDIYSNYPYDVVIERSGDISGTLNYFGTTNNINIQNQVYDWYDVTSLGRLL